MEHDPRKIFLQLFGGESADSTGMISEI